MFEVSKSDLFLLSKGISAILTQVKRGVAQLVARTAGGREVAGSSPVTPTRNYSLFLRLRNDPYGFG
jgi:hypothetical protein